VWTGTEGCGTYAADQQSWDTQLTYPAANPEFGYPYSAVLGLPAYQTPRQIRVGARLEF
jgi:hypothetical protein